MGTTSVYRERRGTDPGALDRSQAHDVRDARGGYHGRARGRESIRSVPPGRVRCAAWTVGIALSDGGILETFAHADAVPRGDGARLGLPHRAARRELAPRRGAIALPAAAPGSARERPEPRLYDDRL